MPGTPFIAWIIKLTQPTPRSYVRHENCGVLHGDYHKEERSSSVCWMPRNFDYEAYADGNISARDSQFGGVHWMRIEA